MAQTDEDSFASVGRVSRSLGAAFGLPEAGRSEGVGLGFSFFSEKVGGGGGEIRVGVLGSRDDFPTDWNRLLGNGFGGRFQNRFQCTVHTRT